jgi:hypothetical protein
MRGASRLAKWLGSDEIDPHADYPQSEVVQDAFDDSSLVDDHALGHADIFQPQGDIGNLHIDRLTGGSNYQGLFLRPEFQVASAIIKNINLRFLPNVHHPVTYLLWMRDSEDSPKLYPVSLESVYLEPRSGQIVSAHAVFPSARSTKYPAVEVDGRVSWPVGSLISGSVLSGTPPSGDFVPEGSAGTSYVSPGYRQE